MKHYSRQLVATIVLSGVCALSAAASSVRAQDTAAVQAAQVPAAQVQVGSQAATAVAAAPSVSSTAAASPIGGNEIRRARQPDGAAPAGSMNNAVMETVRVLGALALVIGAIVILKVVAGQVLGIKSAGANANKGVRVLSRTMIGPKQQMILMQVGRKLVLVSDCAGKVVPVTEVTDPDEVAELAGQALGTATRAGEFTAALQGNTTRYQDNEVSSRGESEYEPVEDELSSDDRGVTAEPSRRGSDEARELSGLADKVRRLGRQFSPG